MKVILAHMKHIIPGKYSTVIAPWLCGILPSYNSIKNLETAAFMESHAQAQLLKAANPMAPR